MKRQQVHFSTLSCIKNLQLTFINAGDSLIFRWNGNKFVSARCLVSEICKLTFINAGNSLIFQWNGNKFISARCLVSKICNSPSSTLLTAWFKRRQRPENADQTKECVPPGARLQPRADVPRHPGPCQCHLWKQEGGHVCLQVTWLQPCLFFPEVPPLITLRNRNRALRFCCYDTGEFRQRFDTFRERVAGMGGGGRALWRLQ